MPRTPEQIRKQQIADANNDTTKIKASLPAPTNGSTALAAPDNRSDVQRYIDEIAPASIVGRMVKFSKDGQ